jgi:hypothetical protein
MRGRNVKNTTGPSHYGPFTYLGKDVPQTGDRYEFKFTVEQDGRRLGSAIASLKRSAETRAASRAPNGASDMEVRAQLRAGLRKLAETELKELLDHRANSLKSGSRVRLLDISSSNDDLIDRLVRVTWPG